MNTFYKSLLLMGAFMVAWSIFGSSRQINYIIIGLLYVSTVLWTLFKGYAKFNNDFIDERRTK